jgi:hypothetical protein
LKGEPVHSPADVAEWMVEQLKEEDPLYQEVVVYEIQERFGDEFVYENENGNLAISRKVLSEFRKRTERNVVWERGERLWRKREEYDGDGRAAE